MATAYISHPACLKHEGGIANPESPARITAIEKGLVDSGLMQFLDIYEAPAATNEQLLRAHEEGYIDSIEFAVPKTGFVQLDNDTALNPYTYQAAIRAAGAVALGVDLVMSGKVDNAFCNVRPGGHHATSIRASGFCFFNNVAIGALHALEHHGLNRVAIIDFDAHHGNGTESILRDDPGILFCSSFQHPFYPYSGAESTSANTINVTLAAGSGSDEFREAVKTHWLPALERFQPELILISAGFDAHRDDAMSFLNFTEADYAWISAQLKRFAGGRIVSALEGGYEMESLARSAAAHIRALVEETP
jgi:acetoin utilization deacetylase AcuC-like enzyme